MITSYKKPVITYPRKEYLQEISNNDPLFIYDYTPRFMNVLNTNKFQKKYKFPEKLEIPVFVAVADQDELFSIESVQKFHDEIPSQKKEFHLIANAKHAEYPEGAWDRLVAWVSENFK